RPRRRLHRTPSPRARLASAYLASGGSGERVLADAGAVVEDARLERAHHARPRVVREDRLEAAARAAYRRGPVDRVVALEEHEHAGLLAQLHDALALAVENASDPIVILVLGRADERHVLELAPGLWRLEEQRDVHLVRVEMPLLAAALVH